MSRLLLLERMAETISIARDVRAAAPVQAFMHTYSMRKGTRRSERGFPLFTLILRSAPPRGRRAGTNLLAQTVVPVDEHSGGQLEIPGRGASFAEVIEQASLTIEYLDDAPQSIYDVVVMLGGPVVFDHWLHRSMFTCRVCHVDVGFAMQAKATGISASTNRAGFHCGACHDGKRSFEGKTIFAACSDAAPGKQCAPCHSSVKKDARKYEYKQFTAKFPKDIYGVNWEEAEKSGVIHPIDFVEGLSVKKTPMSSREDFTVKPAYSWVRPILFSHEKHCLWNGCELCHPEIFPAAKKGTIRYSMFANIEGRYCGACHGRVAFPLNNCRNCHPGGPLWAP